MEKIFQYYKTFYIEICANLKIFEEIDHFPLLKCKLKEVIQGYIENLKKIDNQEVSGEKSYQKQPPKMTGPDVLIVNFNTSITGG